jgi:hypothetical protein
VSWVYLGIENNKHQLPPPLNRFLARNFEDHSGQVPSTRLMCTPLIGKSAACSRCITYPDHTTNPLHSCFVHEFQRPYSEAVVFSRLVPCLDHNGFGLVFVWDFHGRSLSGPWNVAANNTASWHCLVFINHLPLALGFISSPRSRTQSLVRPW